MMLHLPKGSTMSDPFLTMAIVYYDQSDELQYTVTFQMQMLHRSVTLYKK